MLVDNTCLSLLLVVINTQHVPIFQVEISFYKICSVSCQHYIHRAYLPGSDVFGSGGGFNVFADFNSMATEIKHMYLEQRLLKHLFLKVRELF